MSLFLSLSHTLSRLLPVCCRNAHARILQLPLAVNATTANTKNTQIAHTARWHKSVCRRGRKGESTRVWLCEGSSGSVKGKCRKFALHMPRRTFHVPTNCIALSIQNGFIIFASVNNSPLMTTATRTIWENNDTKSRNNKNIDNSNRKRTSFC